MSFNVLTKTLTNLRNRVSPGGSHGSTTKPTHSGVSHHPSDRLYAQVVHSSTPANSPEATLASLTRDQDPETSDPTVEEVGDHTPPKVRPPSQVSIDDGRPLDVRLQEIRDLSSKLLAMRSHKNYLKDAPPLHKLFVSKINALLDYTALMGVETLYRPELLDHATVASQIRTTFSEAYTQFEEGQPRRRSNTLDSNMFSAIPQTAGISSSPQFASNFAQTLHRLSTAHEPSEDVFSPKTMPTVPQPGQSPELQVRDRSLSSQADVVLSLDHVFNRIGESEAKWEQAQEEMKLSIEGLISSVNGIKGEMEKIQHQVVRHSNDLQSIQKFNEVEFHQTVKGIRDRCHNLESMPAPASVNALRKEVDKVQQGLAALKVGQDITLNPKLNSIIVNSLQAFRSQIIKPLQSRISKVEANTNITNLSAELGALKTRVDTITNPSSSNSNPESCPYSMQINDMLSRVTSSNRQVARLREEVKKLQSQSSGNCTHTSSTASTLPLATSATASKHDIETNVHQNISAGEGNLKFLHQELDTKIKKVKHIIGSDTTWKSDVQEVKRIYAIDRPRITKLMDQISSVVSQISKSENIDGTCYINYTTIIDDADAWLKELDDSHHQITVAASGQLSNLSNTAANITPFSANASQNIYEFLADFEAAYLHVGNSKQRAERLYKHLSESIQLSCVSVSSSYTELRALLVSKFGNVSSILNLMFTIVEAAHKATGQSNATQLNYFSQWAKFFLRADQLGNNATISAEEVNRHLSSVTVFDRLIATLSEHDETILFHRLRENGIDTNQPQGPFALRLLRAYIKERVEDLNRLISRRDIKSSQQPQSKQKGVAINQASVSPEVVSNSPTIPTVTATQVPTRTSPPWWTNGLAFPCPLINHDHEIATCSEYLSMTPTQRRTDAKNNSRRICWACLRPFSSCRKKCVQDTRIKDILKCPGCVDAAKGKDYPPKTVLFCTNPDHESRKPTPTEFFRELKWYLKIMAPTITENTVVFSNLSFVTSSLKPENSMSAGNPSSKSREVDPKEPVSVYETSSGDKVGTETRSLHESVHDACLLLQIVKIGKTQCLLMFDRGANVNLIDGEVAEREELCVLNQDPTTINVAGGDKLLSQYGKYLITLGAHDLGWHRLTCHGMPEVTVKFPRYDLSDVNRECRNAFGKSLTLPTFTGGAPVSLLIGIQNVMLDPVRIGILPSGVGVFQSPFRDIFGSNICYAGPHPSFTRTNLSSQFTTSATSLFLSSCQSWSSQITNNPHLFETEHHCRTIEEDLPVISLPCYNHTGNGINHKFKPSALKALIPNSKLREICDQEDFSDTVNYRCPECSDCQNCKKSSKVRAMSMQDAREQLAIEQSIEIKLSSKEVWVDLPFIIDPVKFLSKRHNGSDNYRQALKVYQGQCRKPDHIREGIRKRHRELVSQGFITKLTDLPHSTQKLIQDAPFCHYFPFRSVCKDL